MTQRKKYMYWFKYILLSSNSLPCYIAPTHTDVLTIKYDTIKPEPSENSTGRALKRVSKPHPWPKPGPRIPEALWDVCQTSYLP